MDSITTKSKWGIACGNCHLHTDVITITLPGIQTFITEAQQIVFSKILWKEEGKERKEREYSLRRKIFVEEGKKSES